MPSTPNEIKASKAYHKAVKELEAFKKITAQRNKEYYENNKEILAQKRREKYLSKKQLKNQVINVVKIDTENEENKQDITANIQVNNNVEPEPEITNNEPEITNNEPEITNNEPEITNNEPEITNNEPEITINEPEITINEPEITINEPEITINEPEITINEPEITINEPEITINEPEITINEPEIKNENLVLSVNIPVQDDKTLFQEFKKQIKKQIEPEIIKFEPKIIKEDIKITPEMKQDIPINNNNTEFKNLHLQLENELDPYFDNKNYMSDLINKIIVKNYLGNTELGLNYTAPLKICDITNENIDISNDKNALSTIKNVTITRTKRKSNSSIKPRTLKRLIEIC